ncbi:2-oxoglutarate ferredoxin oxidoreductase subunit beta [Chitinophaga ginsengisegetis]|uniref:2-oxoglutarate ferredoxin oxidoreductase subunit beta n=1 Tax=Chitinophaga ginsengisegetis TaxID=393003 RepID=A0A1T5P5A5_9BACT|nr:2-oxoacid:ferredoxin oxidoreductase subunit beta [Chitinophaga ginsengisegetis]MDR6566496.1 2-oxoglutarate ferredoxin oxidoreductase subunit beta [Chitinophaga ginsengisegetis]MDR6646226.1 2-oxoglutarate ferredoxin oxidoreductase subunit beta [Chitinophaga ginsengisegetis]MDR6651181.1 2-oxoglutarate ferredoxin oxidoreductase subunit beta [Chitinophaga ginsengisegetis]SKD07970.1 2-oxoglutarate ferredoxin oxidoreductase subunit beta [Chitinophaga ginsengisegetis]
MSTATIAPQAPLTSKDFATDQEVRWCPGCGDYSILKQVQTIMPTLGVPRENIVIVSGIGCSSRFPYYMNTYGMHSIHGRATAIASGLKAARPELSVWIVTGDGDGLSIGGNHTIHLLRRNFDVNIMLFNNQIYGLTKGQYSPTSEENKVTKSTPMGSIDHPFNPMALALGADATFIARSMDRDPKHLQEMLKRSHAHKGASFLEIYQNCNIFNDGAFEAFTEKSSKADETIFVEHGKPLVFGATKNKGIRLDGLRPVAVELGSEYTESDLWIHDENDFYKAQLLTRMFDDVRIEGHLPRPFGIFYEAFRPTYEDIMGFQLTEALAKKGPGDLDKLLAGSETWTIKG